MPIFGRRSFSCLFFFIYGDFDMMALVQSAGDHKFLPFFKRYPNQLIFCTQGFFDMENSNLKDFFILTTRSYLYGAGSIPVGDHKLPFLI